MKQVVYFFILSLVCCISASSQARVDSVQTLDEVVVTNQLLANFSTGQKILRLSDSLLRQNPAHLTDVLNFNSGIHFNQNGYGMVASPAFRGTTAQQTAVVWNGININSSLNGQSDFNTLLQPTLQQVQIKPGGGSVIYGTGAIGGSIYLDSKLAYRESTKHYFQSAYGSFNTLDSRYQWKQSSDKWSFVMGLQHLSSDNDFPIAQSQRKNLHGAFLNHAVGFDAAYRVHDYHQLKLYTWLFLGDRNLSVIRPSDTKAKYENSDIRTLLEWEYKKRRWRSVLKTGFFKEDFSFTENVLRSDEVTSNTAETFLAQYNLQYEISSWVFSTLIDAISANASGDNLLNENRNTLAMAFLAKRKINTHWIAEASLRKEFSNLYNSPLLYSIGSSYRFTDFYSMRFQASKNFRIPTFNDLFWTTSGSTSIRPETAHQVEWGHDVSIAKFQFSATGFYTYIDDLIRWIPNENGTWKPENVEGVNSYGGELEASYFLKNTHHDWHWNVHYAFTISENRETGLQLRYIPKHKLSSTIAYSWKRWRADTQIMYVGEQYARSNNDPTQVIAAYALQNLGFRYQLLDTSPSLQLGIRVFNVWDTTYQAIEFRPMPGRSIQFQFTLIL